MSSSLSSTCAHFSDNQTATLCTFLQAQIDAQSAQQANLAQQSMNDTNSFFLITMGALIVFMHAGFAMLYAGAVRSKNVRNILLCTTMDMCVCAIGWFLTGFGFAFGADNGSGFIGTTYFVGLNVGATPQWSTTAQWSGSGTTFAFWFFQFAIAATAATIVVGAIAERTRLESYILYIFVLSAFVYPVVAHWVWGGGFLTLGHPNAVLNLGSLDFTGDGPVHMLGGLTGALASKIMGPRIGRYDSKTGSPVAIPGHSSSLINLGTFCLWFGWLGFNAGSVINVTGGNGSIAARVAVNTILASAGGLLAALFCSYVYYRPHVLDFGLGMNGALAGLVSIGGSCPAVEMWAAICIGAIGGGLYVWASQFVFNVMKLDDPLDATAVHFFCGVWGLLASGAFANPVLLSSLLGAPTARGGFLYASGGGDLLACQLVEICVVCAFVAGVMTPLFLVLSHFDFLRIQPDVEEEGLEWSLHGGAAFPPALYEEKKRTKPAAASSSRPTAHVQEEQEEEVVRV